VIGPLVGADRDRVAATIVGAVDEDAAHAGGAHFSDGDLLRERIGGCRLAEFGPISV
jgi:hypothetical protein